jgi:hypothetical protein
MIASVLVMGVWTAVDIWRAMHMEHPGPSLADWIRFSLRRWALVIATWIVISPESRPSRSGRGVAAAIAGVLAFVANEVFVNSMLLIDLVKNNGLAAGLRHATDVWRHAFMSTGWIEVTGIAVAATIAVAVTSTPRRDPMEQRPST